MLLLLFFLSFPGLNSFGVPDWKKHKILIINSYSPLRVQGTQIVNSLRNQLTRQAELYTTTEYMDCETNSGFEQWTTWLSSLFNAYETPPQLVIILGNEAWSTYKECCIDSWKDIPVVLGLVKQRYPDYRQKGKTEILKPEDLFLLSSDLGNYKVYGYYIQDYIKENVELIKQLQPENKDITCFYDNRYNYAYIEGQLMNIVKQAGNLNLHYLPGNRFSTPALLDSINNFPGSVLLSLGWYSDANKDPHAHSMLHNKLANYSNRGIYEVLDQDFNNPNYLGGYFVSGDEIGKDIAHLAYQVLLNKKGNVPGIQPTPSQPKYHLNYQIFNRLGLNEKLLPPEVVWHNTELSIYKKHPIATVFFTMLLILTIIVSSMALLIRRRREQSYIISNQKMKRLLESMPNMVVVYDSSQRILDIINPMQEILYYFKPEEVIGLKMKDMGEMNAAFKASATLIGGYINKVIDTKQTYFFSHEFPIEKGVYYADMKVTPYDEDKVICYIHDTTASVTAKRETVKLKNFLQSIIEHLPIGIFIKDSSDNFRYIYYNQGVADFYEGKSDWILGKNDFEIEDPMAVQYREEDENVLESETPVTYERLLYDKHGSPRWGITTKTRLLNNDGSNYILGLLVDTTEIRKNEIELANIRNELSIALAAGSLSAWVYSVDTQHLSSLYGEIIPEEGIAFEELEKIVHPEDLSNYQQLLTGLTSGKCEKKREILRFLKKDTYTWNETHAIAIRSPQTGQIYQIVGTQKDITEELRKQRESEENRVKMDLVIRSNGITPWDYNTETRYFSTPYTESVAYGGISWDEYLSMMEPEDAFLFTEAFNKILNNETESFNIQIRIKINNPELLWLDFHAMAFKRDAQGRVTQITGLRRDITIEKNNTEELIILRDKAEESNRLKTAFLANMSHEIRTPLNAIVGFSNLITQSSDKEEIEEFCKIIQTNNELLLQLINDILDLSKIEAGQLEFVYTNINIASIFTGLEQVYRLRLQEGVELICELPPENYIIRSEKNRLTQVLSNFLSNANKYTSSGYIKMGFVPIEKGLKFYVTDTGKGIAQESIPHVFERFVKFDAFVQGTGLGLSICETIINRLGGEIGVESELGKGSTFWFSIPCNVNISSGNQQNTKTEHKAPEIQGTDKQKIILVAEDNDSNYLLAASILKKNYRLERALNGVEAIDKYRTLHPDLILMDMKMPIMNGLEATRRIRETDPAIPIIALTANAFDEDREKALAAGCNDYLTKPINIKQLEVTLKEIWENTNKKGCK